MIRLALPHEAAVVRDVVHAAYAHYIDRIGKRVVIILLLFNTGCRQAAWANAG